MKSRFSLLLNTLWKGGLADLDEDWTYSMDGRLNLQQVKMEVKKTILVVKELYARFVKSAC